MSVEVLLVEEVVICVVVVVVVIVPACLAHGDDLAVAIAAFGWGRMQHWSSFAKFIVVVALESALVFNQRTLCVVHVRHSH